MLSKIATFIAQMFTADSGVSFGRGASFLLLVCCVAWDTAYLTFSLIHWKALFPLGMKMGDILPPVATLLGQVTFFSSPYGITKISENVGPTRPQNGQGQ